MLRPLARAVAALAVPLLRPFVDALAEEWMADQDDDMDLMVHKAHPVGFSAPEKPAAPEGPEE